ncbi:hypothetical protein OWV82_020154 [Melia azedarach]|uniref:Uncharacterized protein n=1 Tax=Melia azedarach TaxID=155640 RepID=A0ACC1X5C0_MELAZ|nr:hypothetical protein OWV82_020154 [Melia azedarach]
MAPASVRRGTRLPSWCFSKRAATTTKINRAREFLLTFFVFNGLTVTSTNVFFADKHIRYSPLPSPAC